MAAKLRAETTCHNRAGVVYFVQGVKTGFIKIGFTADLRQRLASIRAHSPDALHVLGFIEDAEAERLEGLLHKMFAEIRLRHEWFSPHPKLVTFIGRNALEYEAEDDDDFDEFSADLMMVRGIQLHLPRPEEYRAMLTEIITRRGRKGRDLRNAPIPTFPRKQKPNSTLQVYLDARGLN